MRGNSRLQACRSVAVGAALVLTGLASAGCSAQLADLAEPAAAPARPAIAPAYPNVNAMPATRTTKPMTAEESRRITNELTAVRAHQEEEITGSIPATQPAR